MISLELIFPLLLPMLCGIGTGLALGLTGGGGSIFAVPLLTFIVGLPVQQATVLSLVAVAITAGIGATRGIIKKIASIKVAIPMLITGMLVSPLGVFASHNIADNTKLGLFASLMILIAAKMLIGQINMPRVKVFSNTENEVPNTLLRNLLKLTRHPLVILSIGGVMTGFLSGFFGVGGGFLIVPTLIFASRLEMHQIISTSMLIITGVSIIAFITFLFSPSTIPIDITVFFIAGNIIGLTTGISLANRMSSERLQQIFAIGIALVGLYTGYSAL